MLKLLKNADVYAPVHLGRRDILIAGSKIAAIDENLDRYSALPEVETVDLCGKIVTPGFIDMHVHITGGGGEQGPVSRVPELVLSQLTTAGVTTVLGLMGTDGFTRSQQSLISKCRALNEEGITAYTLIGSYQYPSPTLTGSVTQDIMMLENVIGCKLALSDHRGSGISLQELIRLASEVRLGGLLSNKPGLLVIHMGGHDRAMQPIFDAIEHGDAPAKTFLPTHCSRSAKTVEQAARLIEMGGAADFTASPASERGGAMPVVDLIKHNRDLGRVCISSDAGGSLPRFDETGRCTGMGVGSPHSLLKELQRMVNVFGLDLSAALAPFTRNPAALLGLENLKGAVCVGAHADLLCLDSKLELVDVYAKGKLMVSDRAAVVRGMFEA